MANNYMLNDQFPKAIKNATSTSDGLMSSEDKAKFDSVFDDLGVLEPATIDKDGLMTKEDKKKLDELEKPTPYTHPDTHPASMIVEDSTHRFVSDENINEWNTKASTALATQITNGLMSSTDKVKLDSLNKYIDKKTVFNLNILIEDKEWGDVNSALGYAVDPFINYLNTNSISLENGMCILFKTSDKIATNNDGLIRNIWQEWIILDKNNYKKKAAWDQLIYRDATEIVSGLMSALDKKKLNQLVNYTHPDTHSASMITTDTNNRFVTDAQITAWNAKASAALVTQTVNGLMSSIDKIKLDGIESKANNYTHPATHAATIITTDSTHRFVTDDQIAYWNAKSESTVTSAVATQTTNGLMSSTDKVKLDGIATNANNYTHPNTHPASIIVEDSTHRFVTDTDKNNLQNLLTRMDTIEQQYAEMLAKLQTAVFIE